MITRAEAKQLLPIIQAFAEGKPIKDKIEGKTIEVLHPNGGWTETDKVYFNLPSNHYRIKEEPKYRPFKSQEECWNEISKHQPFGWLKRIDTGSFAHISRVFPDFIMFNNEKFNHNESFESYTFIDGAPFGIME